MSVLVVTDDRCLEHDTGPGHPERPARHRAVAAGVGRVGDAVEVRPPRPATRDELLAVHDPAHLDHLEAVAAAGGGRLDADTVAGPGSWDAALLAAGAGLVAAEAVEAGSAGAAFCAVRPPGHHALADRAMGFCLLNNVAVCAAHLAARGETVMVLDWDAHHGNGTQDLFFDDDRVLFVSLHQWPLYPGTGRPGDVGAGAGVGSTWNLPLPPGATGDVYLKALDEVVAPAAEAAGVDWVLVSAGFDAHRADPLTDLGLSAGDFAHLAARSTALAPGRTLFFLEGGYDLDALEASVAAVLDTLAGTGTPPAEAPTAGGPGADHLAAAVEARRRALGG